MELLPYFLFCLIFLYFIAIIINSVMVYKILKSEGVDIGFLNIYLLEVCNLNFSECYLEYKKYPINFI